MKNLLIISLISLTLLTSCNDNDCVIGSGTLNDYPLTVNSFDKVSLAGSMDLFITQGSEQTLLIQAEPEIFGIMETKVKNNELIIDFENHSCINSMVGVKVYITVPDIEQISIAGTSNITSDGDLDLDQLTFDVAGSAHVGITGSANTQSFNVSGEVIVRNLAFQTKNTFINISGSGDLEIDCTDMMDINLSGAATIKYTGQPTIKQKVSGSLDLVDVN
ncbi:MAG: head GIN domain-containing protein [Bacteroidota bacterium]